MRGRPIGTVTLSTGTSGASSRGEGGFWPVFGTATLPTSALGASPRGETVISPTSLRLVTFTEQAHHAYRPLRGRLPCAVKPIGLHRANDYALHLPGRASADLTGKTSEGQAATGQANEGRAATGQTTTCQAASCHPTTLQRRTRKRATNPVFRRLAALPIILSLPDRNPTCAQAEVSLLSGRRPLKVPSTG